MARQRFRRRQGYGMGNCEFTASSVCCEYAAGSDIKQGSLGSCAYLQGVWHKVPRRLGQIERKVAPDPADNRVGSWIVNWTKLTNDLVRRRVFVIQVELNGKETFCQHGFWAFNWRTSLRCHARSSVSLVWLIAWNFMWLLAGIVCSLIWSTCTLR